MTRSRDGSIKQLTRLNRMTFVHVAVHRRQGSACSREEKNTTVQIGIKNFKITGRNLSTEAACLENRAQIQKLSKGVR